MQLKSLLHIDLLADQIVYVISERIVYIRMNSFSDYIDIVQTDQLVDNL